METNLHGTNTYQNYQIYFKTSLFNHKWIMFRSWHSLFHYIPYRMVVIKWSSDIISPLWKKEAYRISPHISIIKTMMVIYFTWRVHYMCAILWHNDNESMAEVFSVRPEWKYQISKTIYISIACHFVPYVSMYLQIHTAHGHRWIPLPHKGQWRRDFMLSLMCA